MTEERKKKKKGAKKRAATNNAFGSSLYGADNTPSI